MTSSGTFSFSPSNGELVLAAYERIHVRTPSIRQEHMLSARRELNFMFSSWSNKSPNLWEVLRTQATLTQGTASYDIPGKTIMILDASIVLKKNGDILINGSKLNVKCSGDVNIKGSKVVGN